MILPMTAAMAVMSWMPSAKVNTENVPSRNSTVLMANVYRLVGNATTRMIAATTRTKLAATVTSARTVLSSVPLAIALQLISAVTVTGIVVTCPMRWAVHHVSLAVAIARNLGSNATTTCVFHPRTCVTAPTTVATVPMKTQRFAPTLIATLCGVFSVPITVVWPVTRFAMAWIIVAMVPMRTT